MASRYWQSERILDPYMYKCLEKTEKKVRRRKRCNSSMFSTSAELLLVSETKGKSCTVRVRKYKYGKVSQNLK